MKTFFEIEPAYAAALRAAGLDSFDAIMNMKGGPPASKHRHRETVPVEIPIEGVPRKFFLKRVFKVPPKHAIWPLFRGRPNISQPRNEWNMLAKLYEAGIPAMQRVAYGEQRKLAKPIRAFILVESVSIQFTLEDYLVRHTNQLLVDKRWRDRLMWELGSLFGTLHGNDLSWPDMQAKHIFAEIAGRNWRFQIIDVERVSQHQVLRGRRLDLSRVVDLLRLRESLIPMPFWRADYLHFVAGYLEALASVRQIPRKSIVSKTNARDWYGIVCQRPRWSEGLVPFSMQGFDPIPGGFADTRYVRRLEFFSLTSMDQVFSFQPPESLDKPGLTRHRDRAKFSLSDGMGHSQTCFLKRYKRPPFRERIRHITEYDRRHSTAWRERHFVKRLNQLGICTPQVMAYGEEMSGILENRSFLITKEVPGHSLEKIVDWIAKGKYPAPTLLQRVAVIDELALIVLLMHANRLFHRDLYLSHVFLGQDSHRWPILYLIDLARMIENPLRARRWQIKDLAALEYSAPRPLITRADRIRFLKLYIGDGLHWPWRPNSGKRMMRKEEIRYYARHVRARARRMERHDARRRAKHGMKS